MNQLPFEIRVRIVAALVDGNSIRAIHRQTGVHRDTIMRLGVEVGQACNAFHRTVVGDLQANILELDEIFGFVAKKQGHLEEGDPAEWGDEYTFVGMDANTKFVISYLTGKRNGANAKQFCNDLRSRVLGKPQITTDGFEPYLNAIEESFGADCHYAMHVKEYAGESRRKDAAHRYSPGRVIGAQKFVIMGRPLEEKISTSYIERQNLTMRMHIRRLTRLTNAFSKKLENLRAAIALHFCWYNFVRVHETLRVTPAMQVELTDHVWSIGEMLEIVLGERRSVAA
jgi:IS1 family transposase